MTFKVDKLIVTNNLVISDKILLFSSRKSWIDLSKVINDILFTDEYIGINYRIELSTNSTSPHSEVNHGKSGSPITIFSDYPVPKKFKSEQVREIIKSLKKISKPIDRVWDKYYKLKGDYIPFSNLREFRYTPILHGHEVKYVNPDDPSRIITAEEACILSLLWMIDEVRERDP